MKTLYDSPFLSGFLRRFSSCFLKIFRWKLLKLPVMPKNFVGIAFPHTSNVDAFYGYSYSLIANIRMCVLGKSELFRHAPLRRIFLYLNMVPVQRDESEGQVSAIVKRLRESHQESSLMVIPTGSRTKEKWHSGFYYIAQAMGWPLVLITVNYKKKYAGPIAVFKITGNYDKDVAEIKAIYASFFDAPELFIKRHNIGLFN